MQTAQTKTEHKIPGSIDRCMEPNCGKEFKPGDQVIAIFQRPITVFRNDSFHGPWFSIEKARECVRYWHADCLR